MLTFRDKSKKDSNRELKVLDLLEVEDEDAFADLRKQVQERLQ